MIPSPHSHPPSPPSSRDESSPPVPPADPSRERPPAAQRVLAAAAFATVVLTTVVLAVALLAAAGCRPAADGAGADGGVPVAYVAVGGNNHVRLVDLESGETVRRIYSGAAPWRLALEPGGERLWVQHWYAGTTAVVDLDGHRVTGSLPYRGPGAFLPDGLWLTAHWPGRELTEVDPATLEVVSSHDTEVGQIYDVAPFGTDGERLLMVQYDPMGLGPVPRYGYVLSYHRPGEDEKPGVPVSHPVGVSPVRVVPVPDQPFFLTADSGTNGIHVINDLGDRRALAVCPAPREIALAPGGDLAAVVCWRGRRERTSRVVLLATDFTARPWPELTTLAEAEVVGGLVAAQLSSAGDRLWVVDETGGRLLAFDTAAVRDAEGDDGDGLEPVAEIPVGDHPTDLVLARLAPEDLEAAAEPPPERQALLQALASLAEERPLEDLSWTETAHWREPAEEGDDGGGGEGGEDGEGDGEPEMIERSREVAVELAPPGTLRTTAPDGAVRLAAGGHAVTLDPAGRYWVTPRQDLLGVVLALPALGPQEAVRRLAGDVEGSPYLATGIAVDRGLEVREDGVPYRVVGAGAGGERVSQLWIDLEEGLPTNLVEAFPAFGGGGGGAHGGGEPPQVAETHLLDYAPVEEAGGYPLPRSLRRVVEGNWVQDADVSAVRADRGLAALRFDPVRLGGVEPALDELFAPAGVGALAASGEGGPGEAVPVQIRREPLGSPLAPHPPYPSNPPTSGVYLPWPPRSGVHRVPVPLPLQVHHLLDGGAALVHDCPAGCPDLVAELEAVAARRDGVLVAPYPWLPDGARLAVTAWGRRLLLDDWDAGEVERFLDAWTGTSHHDEVGSPGAP